MTRAWGAALGGAIVLAVIALGAAESAAEPRMVQPPGVAEGAYRGECRTLDRQIDTYINQARLAIDAGNKTWTEASYRRIGHLTQRRARLCPKYVGSTAGEDLLKLMRLGGKVALKMYTMGML